MPNPIAWLALFGWPVFCLTVVAARRSTGHRLARTVAWMMILPVMFLPSAVSFDPPGLPALDKHRITFLSLALALQLFHRRELLARAPGHTFPRWLLLVLLIGVSRTVASNGDVLSYGPRVIPALSTHDILSMGITVFLDIYLPFSVGQRVYQSARDLRDLLVVMSTAALIYLPFILVEVRLSPQLHNWIYGFHPSDFGTSMRQGGFRPVLFMINGLAVAIFLFCSLCAARALQVDRARTPLVSPRARFLISAVLLVLSKSLAATIYAAVVTASSWLLGPRGAARLVVLLGTVVMVFPLLRSQGHIPTGDVVAFFAKHSGPERAQSLEFRFDNEDMLLAHAMKRPAFGWGGFGRNRVYNEWGKDNTVTDGRWIILLGAMGYVGFLAVFTLLVGPLLRFARHRRHLDPDVARALSVFALMLAFMVFDLLPNADFDSLPMVYAGVLWTLSHRLSRPPQPATLPPTSTPLPERAQRSS